MSSSKSNAAAAGAPVLEDCGDLAGHPFKAPRALGNNIFSGLLSSVRRTRKPNNVKLADCTAHHPHTGQQRIQPYVCLQPQRSCWSIYLSDSMIQSVAPHRGI